MPVTKTTDLLKRFSKMKVLILGDMMVDAYYWGKVSRISPEAPVPVVSLEKREFRLGGAANVGINIKALGATPILCSFIGKDESSKNFINCVKADKLSSEGILFFDDRKTTVKRRIIGNNHQLLRIDEETEEALSNAQLKKYKKHIDAVISKHKFDVIIIEDYDKGALNPDVIDFVIALASKLKIPVAVDPKRMNFRDYKNVQLFKPNLHELNEGLRITVDTNSADSMAAEIQEFVSKNSIDSVLVTLSEKGVFYMQDKKQGIIPAYIRNIADVSGAGDTVISVASLCLAAGLSIEKIAELSNLAGGLVCEKVGVVPIDPKLWREQIEQNNIY